MDPIAKEPPVYRGTRSSSPIKQRRHSGRSQSFPPKFVSIRTKLTDELREVRMANLSNYRDSPGPGNYDYQKQFGASLTCGTPAVSRLQCFGSTESRACMSEKRSPRNYNAPKLRPRAEAAIRKYLPSNDQKLCKGGRLAAAASRTPPSLLAVSACDSGSGSSLRSCHGTYRLEHAFMHTSKP